MHLVSIIIVSRGFFDSSREIFNIVDLLYCCRVNISNKNKTKKLEASIGLLLYCRGLNCQFCNSDLRRRNVKVIPVKQVFIY